jgi:hypothetical protein
MVSANWLFHCIWVCGTSRRKRINDLAPFFSIKRTRIMSRKMPADSSLVYIKEQEVLDLEYFVVF